MTEKNTHELYAYIFAGMMAAIFLLWPPNEPSPSDFLNSRTENGTLAYKISKGSGYLIFNGKSVSCVGGDFIGGRNCPGLLPYRNVSLDHCVATFTTVKSRFGVNVEFATSISCKDKPLPQLTEDALRSSRINMRDSYLHFVIPGICLIILIFGSFYIQSTRRTAP